MTRPIGCELALALCLSLERSQADITEALALLRRANRDAASEAQQRLARAISRLEMMRMALGRRDDGPILT
jgi:hypothetical protein